MELGQPKKRLFKEVKDKFTKKLILKVYWLELSTRVEINALDFVLGTCLLQKHSEVWHPVAYYSYKITPPELNYNI